jgi:predicted nucleic acid-binding protein
MSRLLDTWAWMEFYDGSSIGEDIYNLIQGKETVYTSTVTIAELSDNYQRENLVTDHSWTEIRNFIESKSEVISPNPEIASKAGKIKKRARKKQSDFGLMDAIILATAREKDLKLLTGDPHLTDKKNVEDLR